MKTAILCDVHNLYIAINKKYPGKVLNYTALINFLVAQEYDLFHKVAYGRQPEDKVRSFSTMLKKNGFEVQFGNTPHNIEMSLKAANLIHTSKIDTLIVGTNYFEAGRILRYAKDHGINAIAMGCELPSFFESFSTMWELEPEFLQDRKPRESEDAPKQAA
jgi:DNA-binding LacI/PurR family transcriptional regulator